MNRTALNTARSFTIMGLIFVAAGFIQQGMTLSFESGLFNLGIIFTLGGLAGIAVDKRLNSK